MQKAADFCADVVIGGGWVDTVAERASGYVSEETWQRLLRGRRGRYCKALARVAEHILAGKQKIHNALGFLASRGVRLLGGSDAIQAFTEELVEAIPLPLMDAKLVAAARGIQVTGVFLCVANDRDLTRCECFVALALTETKAQVKKILLTAMTDWANLRKFPPKTGG